jgi:hypothetical protein
VGGLPMKGTTMLSVSGGCEASGTVTGTLLDAIRRGKIVSDRVAGENVMLRAEVARLTSENAELRARLSQRIGERVL